MPPPQKKLKLLIGVIRDLTLWRPNNPMRARADAEYKARRPVLAERGHYQCAACDYVTKLFIEMHHADGDHANNCDENLVCVDTLCHSYNHLGQLGSKEQFGLAALQAKTLPTVLAAIPELTPESANLLQRAIGVALLDEAEAPIAKRIAKRLSERYKPVVQAFGTAKTSDFAAAMVTMDEEAYEARAPVVGDLRLLFSQDVLVNEGRRFLKDFPALPFSCWGDVVKNAQVSNAK